MLKIPYSTEELKFAYCHRIYLRCHTRRRRSVPHIMTLDSSTLAEILVPYNIRVLECNATETSLLALLSLKYDETVSCCASKLKGRVSRWLHDATGQPGLLSRGYFALTAGTANEQAVNNYLESQSAHHHYESRARPPVYVRSFAPSKNDLAILRIDHAVTKLAYHVVLSTWYRRGVFTRRCAEEVTQLWLEKQKELRIALTKVSFVPDHVHLAIKTHPTVSIPEVIAALMNGAQELVWKKYDGLVIQAGVERLWQPSAYFGSYGRLSSPEVAAYIQGF